MVKVIVVTGAPASGKTTFVNKVGEDFSLPVIAKDELKEVLFDTVGVADREFGRKLGVASFELIYLNSSRLMRSDVAHIIEGNFKAGLASDVLNKMSKRYGCEFLQFNFFVQGDELNKRFKHRWENRENGENRHEYHRDNEHYEYINSIGGRIDALDIAGKLIEVDTTSFELVDNKYFYEEIDKFLNQN